MRGEERKGPVFVNMMKRIFQTEKEQKVDKG